MMTTKVQERPILFSGPMVRAILDGRKTQTRRVVKPQSLVGHCGGGVVTKCPYGGTSDRLWVRETWAARLDQDHVRPNDLPRGTVGYWADGPARCCNTGCPGAAGKVRPSIFMPRWASRITLEITGVRIQRVQKISEEDAEAEGIDIVIDQHRSPWCASAGSDGCACGGKSNREHFALLWDSINAKRGFGWDVNPWVWVVEFKRVAE